MANGQTPEQYITDAEGKRIAVVVPIEVYERLIEKLEDYMDAEFARDYAAREAAGQLTADETEMIPWEQVQADFEARHGTLSDPPS